MNKLLDKQSRIPLYRQLVEEVIKKIENNAYYEGYKLPSERKFCETYDLSRITVRQAMQDLEREGYIYKYHGKGTFVAPKTYNQNLVNLYSFTEEMKKLGKVPTVKVLSFERFPIDERLASKIQLDAGEEVYQIVRLRIADGEPLMYETTHLPAKLFPNLTGKQLSEKPMYNIFRNHYNINVTRAIEKFSATITRDHEAKHLETYTQNPAMLIKRFAYHRDTLIEYTISVARGEKFDYTVELN
ncbi:GntR family transcriptional regulator [Natribacillus halophilus]|uniref:GntR family transcriptional regulator n=1 Tax=Natribacillus halophilus TaxID=549003 RepID=UPI001FE10D0A|nr:GntR family transcriptional regulator [Natribacillus halophilus]